MLSIGISGVFLEKVERQPDVHHMTELKMAKKFVYKLRRNDD